MDTGSFRIPVIVDAPPLRPKGERLDARGNGFGTCLSCKKFKRLWARLCAMCGGDCE